MVNGQRYRAAAKAARADARAAAIAALAWHTSRGVRFKRACQLAANAARRTYRAGVAVRLGTATTLLTLEHAAYGRIAAQGRTLRLAAFK